MIMQPGIFHNSNFRFIRIAVLLFGWMIAAGASAATVEPPTDNRVAGETRLTQKGLYRITVEKAPTPVPTNRLQTWVVAVTNADGKPLPAAMLAVSGSMPQHGHGMLVDPRASRQTESGRFLVEGLKFHMPGYWEVKFTVTADGRADDLVFTLDLQ